MNQFIQLHTPITGKPASPRIVNTQQIVWSEPRQEHAGSILFLTTGSLVVTETLGEILAKISHL
jgi:hypothetical protein